jgi:outer membrane cobalamin receptor
MKKQFSFLMPALLCIMIICANAVAEEADSTKDDLPVYHLGEVVVIGKRTPKPPSAISEISAKTIESRGATTAGEALSSTPGAMVSTGYKNSTEINIRGFFSRDVLILVDGRPVNLPYYGDLDLTSLPINNVSKIVVIKGPASSLYGANTMGGIVNIVTKRITTKRAGDLQISFGEAHTWNSALNYGSKIGKFDFWFTAGKNKSDGFYLSEDFQPGRWEDGGLRENSDYDRFNLDGKLNYTLSARTDLSLSLGYFDGEKGLPGGINEDLPKFWRFVDWKRRYFDLAGESYLGSRWYMKAKLYFDGCKNRLIDYDSTYIYENRNYDSIHDSWDLGGSFLWRLSWRENDQSEWGVNVRQDGIRKRMDSGEPWETYQTITTSLFTQHRMNPLQSVSSELGLAWNILTSQGLEKSKNSFDPSLGVWFDVFKPVRLRLSTSYATRFPTLRQLYGEDSGNIHLKPEKALKLEGGIVLEFASYLQASVDFFKNEVKDLIERKGRGYQYINVDQVILQGIESGLQGNIKEELTFQVDYTYLDAYDDKTGYWLSYRPAHKLDLSLSYAPPFGLSVFSSGQYVSKRVTPHPESELLPHYFVVNLKISQKVKGSFYPFIEIKNLSDANYEEEKGFPTPGRTSLFGVKIVF